MSQVMNYTNKELRALARKRKIRYYYVMKTEELCEILGIEYRPLTVRKTTPVSIKCVENDETTHFPSLSMLAKVMGKNIGSVIRYEKTKRPIPVTNDQSEVIPSGGYVIDQLSTN